MGGRQRGHVGSLRGDGTVPTALHSAKLQPYQMQMVLMHHGLARLAHGRLNLAFTPVHNHKAVRMGSRCFLQCCVSPVHGTVLRDQRLCHGSLCLAHCPLRCKQTKLMEQRVSSLGRLMLSGMGVTTARDARGLRLCAETTTRMAMVAGRIGFNLPRERHFCHTATEPVQGSQIRRHHQQGCPAMGGESVVINGQRSRRRRSLNRCSIGGEDQGCWCLCLPSFFWVFFRSVLELVAGNRTGRRGVSHPPPASVRACSIFH
jgi:hypothetical protein